MHIELTERELRYINRVVNVRLDELLERCARIRRIRSLEDIDTSERFSLAESEIKVMKESMIKSRMPCPIVTYNKLYPYILNKIKQLFLISLV